MANTSYWLMKTEPESYSIQDLAAETDRQTHWDGVRNYQARNFMRDMQIGDRVLFYHSNAKPPAVVGTAQVVRTAYPDFTAWDPTDHHFDARSKPEKPLWDMVDIQLAEVFPSPLGLDQLRQVAALKDMELLRKGSRLSVQPVAKKEFDTILKLAAKAVGKADPSPAKKKSPRRKATKKNADRVLILPSRTDC